MRFRDPAEWLIAALRQFDCDSLRSIEGGECGRRGGSRGDGIKDDRGLAGGWWVELRCLRIIVKNDFSPAHKTLRVNYRTRRTEVLSWLYARTHVCVLCVCTRVCTNDGNG